MTDEKLKIIHEDNHIIVVLKPYNVPSQKDSSEDLDMLTIIKDYLKATYKKEGNIYLALIHRLDRPTSGIMVFAKTDKAASRLSKQLASGKFIKNYLAVVQGVPVDRRQRLTHYLVKDTKNNIVKAHVASVENSKKAILDYKVIDYVDNLALLDIHLITGRSHQARVQLAKIGHPIYADHKYSPPGKVQGYGEKLALFAYSLSFTHPVTKETLVFKSYPPEQIPFTKFSIDKHIGIIKPE